MVNVLVVQAALQNQEVDLLLGQQAVEALVDLLFRRQLLRRVSDLGVDFLQEISELVQGDLGAIKMGVLATALTHEGLHA